MTALPEASERLTRSYPCGCLEVWMVHHVPEDQLPRDVVGTEDCHTAYCTDTEAHLTRRCRSTQE